MNKKLIAALMFMVFLLAFAFASIANNITQTDTHDSTQLTLYTTFTETTITGNEMTAPTYRTINTELVTGTEKAIVEFPPK